MIISGCASGLHSGVSIVNSTPYLTCIARQTRGRPPRADRRRWPPARPPARPAGRGRRWPQPGTPSVWPDPAGAGTPGHSLYCSATADCRPGGRGPDSDLPPPRPAELRCERILPTCCYVLLSVLPTLAYPGPPEPRSWYILLTGWEEGRAGRSGKGERRAGSPARLYMSSSRPASVDTRAGSE